MRTREVVCGVVFLFVSAFGVSAADSAPVAGGVVGVVSATTLNVRVRPATKYTAVAKLVKGDKVRVLRYEKDWYEIVAPEKSSVWISASLVENGFVVKRANLRSGPSVAFSSYRVVDPGEKVSVVDSTREKWLRIAPPRGLTAWVSAKYIHLNPKAAAKLAGKPLAPAKTVAGGKKKAGGEAAAVVAKGGAPEKGGVGAKSAAGNYAGEKKQEALPFLGKGRDIRVEGTLIRLRSDTAYVAFAVASKVNGEYFPLCYIHSGKRDISSFENSEVVVSGLQRFVKGWRRPVLDLRSISSASSGAEKASEKESGEQ